MATPIKIKAQVKEIVSHGEGVYTIILVPSRKMPRFRPGQFLHLTIDPFTPEDGFWPESRVFSIASDYSEECITVVYSVKGKYTTRICRELHTGQEVWLKLPYGDFCIDGLCGTETDVLLIAGGTGISPFVPFLDQESRNHSNRRIALVYGVRNENHLLFNKTLSLCKSNKGKFTISVFMESIPEDGIASYLPGRIEFTYIWEQYKQLNEPACFLSGPPSMIQDFKSRLLLNGVPTNKVYTDEWE